MLWQNKQQPNVGHQVLAVAALDSHVTQSRRGIFDSSRNPLCGEGKRDETTRTCAWEAIAALPTEASIRFSSRANSGYIVP